MTESTIRNSKALRDRLRHQDLMIVSRGPARAGKVSIGSVLTNCIVGEVDVEIIENNVVVTVRRMDESYFGPVSMVVV